jgi:hypothetical protein
MSSPKRRIETDVMKLMMSDYEVTLVNDNMQEFFVIFKGPTESKIPRFRYRSCPVLWRGDCGGGEEEGRGGVRGGGKCEGWLRRAGAGLGRYLKGAM